MDVLVAGGADETLDPAINDKTGILEDPCTTESAKRKNVSPSLRKA